MNALGTVNDGEFEKMLKASKALKIKVNRDEFPKSPVIAWKLQGKSPRIMATAIKFAYASSILQCKVSWYKSVSFFM
jgi:hypothetical protein